jgi:hypothetical protein
METLITEYFNPLEHQNYWQDRSDLYELTDERISCIEPIEQNDKIKLPLMDHQKRALSYCSYLENNLELKIPGISCYDVFTDKALYCDPVGAGKSLVMLSLISNKPCLYPKAKSLVRTAGSIGIVKNNMIREMSPLSIIVAPSTLFIQWREYIQTQTKLRFSYILTMNDFTNLDVVNKDGILVSANLYNTLCKVMTNIHVSRIIFDEVHMLKIKKERDVEYDKDKISASFYWFISASPYEIRRFIMSKRGFLYRALEDVLEMQNYGLVFKNEDKLIKKKIVLPPPINNVLKCKNSRILSVLSNVVSEEVLEMISADDVNGAMNRLGVEKVGYDSIISIVSKDLLSKKDKILNDITYLNNTVWKNEREKDKAIDNHRQKIVELDRKIEMIKSRIAEENMDPITCEDIVNPAITPCCQNTFEFKSLTSYLIKEKTVCPICRAVLLPEKLIVIDKNGKQEEIETKKQVVTKTKEIYDSKLEALSDILKKMNKSSKIIIASGPTANYKDVLHVIESSTLRMRKLDGNIFVRNKILEEFKTKDLNILYLPAYESGSGLNIVNATDLIFLHKMSDGNMNQVTGRAQRLGRKSPLTIWKILYEDEINRTF